LFPLVRNADLPIFASIDVFLEQSLEIVLVILPAEVELATWKAGHVCTLQNLILLMAIVHPLVTELDLKLCGGHGEL